MTYDLTQILPFLMTEAPNILPAFVCLLALCGTKPRLCLTLTLLIHLGLMVL